MIHRQRKGNLHGQEYVHIGLLGSHCRIMSFYDIFDQTFLYDIFGECEKDRILFFNREINNLKQLSYEVDENLLISDHRPVFGDFNLNVSFSRFVFSATFDFGFNHIRV